MHLHIFPHYIDINTVLSAVPAARERVSQVADREASVTMGLPTGLFTRSLEANP